MKLYSTNTVQLPPKILKYYLSTFRVKKFLIVFENKFQVDEYQVVYIFSIEDIIGKTGSVLRC